MSETSSSYRWGFIVGALVGLVLCIVLIKALLGWKGACRREYDERQQLAIGKGYKYGYYAMLIYIAVYALFDLMTGIHWCEVYTGLFIGVLLSVGIFGVVCIRNDAYLPLKQSPCRYITMFLVLGALNLGIGALHYVDEGTFVENGMLNNSIVNPLVGLLLVVLAVALWVKTLHEKNARETE